MADRRPFEEKYRDLPSRWNIESDVANYIIRRYTKKLEEELELLKEHKIKLPSFFRDRRTEEDYVYDLIDGWLVEDIVCDAWLRRKVLSVNKKIKITHMGTNRDRTLQKYNPRKITTEPDFVYVAPSGEEVKIELQMARKLRKEGYDMKESKVKRAVEKGHLFLWILFPEDEYFVIDPARELKGIEPMTNPLWGGKLVYRLKNERLEKIGVHEMAQEIPESLYGLLKLK